MDGGVEFRYNDDYLRDGVAIASTLPLTDQPIFTAAGAVPPFFAGLLPEGRRLTALRRVVKSSADDELSLLVAVGSDTIGDVQIVPRNSKAPHADTSITITKSFDEISFDDLIGESSSGGSTKPALAGVQDKVSARMISVPIAQRRARYILKLNPPEYAHLVENEAFFLDLARSARMPVAASRVVHDRDGASGLLVTRFDREWDGEDMRMLAVEDACQALALWPADKYNVPMEDAATALLNLTPARVVAAQAILRQTAYAWLTGNGDLHSKNLAVLNSPDTGQRISPAYDLPSTLFYGDSTLALTIGGRDTLAANRLRNFARFLGVPDKAAETTVIAVLKATGDLSAQLGAAKLGFDSKTTDKVVRQLTTRHREIARVIGD
jgi:serine/threonine-protein kinase HipA